MYQAELSRNELAALVRKGFLGRAAMTLDPVAVQVFSSQEAVKANECATSCGLPALTWIPELSPEPAAA